MPRAAVPKVMAASSRLTTAVYVRTVGTIHFARGQHPGANHIAPPSATAPASDRHIANASGFIPASFTARPDKLHRTDAAINIATPRERDARSHGSYDRIVEVMAAAVYCE